MKTSHTKFFIPFLIICITLIYGCSDIQQENLTITHINTWGTTGSEPGQLLHPIGITLHESNLYISDAGNHRIQVFGKDGSFIRTFGSKGKETGQVNRPMHLEFGGDTLYVPEYLNDRIQLFSPTGQSLSIFGEEGTGKGHFDAPGGIAADKKSGSLLVADFYNHLIQKFDTDGIFIRQFGKGNYGTEPGVFTYPTDVAFLSGGRFVVADAYNNRIQLLNSAGEVEWMIPENTTEADSSTARFNVATAVATDFRDRIYTVDFENHRIQIFSEDGDFLTQFGTNGNGDGEFERPTDVAIDKNGHIFVVDFGNNRIQQFNIKTDN